MSEIGIKVQEAVDLMNAGSYELAFVPTAEAIEGTLARSLERLPGELDYQNFFRDHWQLIAFMGMPRALPLPLNIPFAIKRVLPSFNVLHGAPEIILLVVTEALKFKKMPDGFAFNTTGEFDVKDGHALLPVGLVCGLLGSVIFHPSNKGEAIGEEYWINISDFKMFVSELFGRQDLALRIMKFYER
jgi:hypothetical protein